jgi:AMMECR1 domain-containing protein
MISAFKDSRYPPISKNELEHLKIIISYLKNFEKRDDPNDWERGKHGIILSFTANEQEYSSTYLPEVPLEHFETKEKAMIGLVKKAG